MAPRTTYANLPNGLHNLTLWDNSLSDMGKLGIIPCSCTNVGNVYNLASITVAYAPNFLSYQNYYQYSFEASATSTGLVTLKVATGAALPVYVTPGVQATTGHILSGSFYTVVYSDTLDGGNGGFWLGTGGGSAVVAPPGAAGTILRSDGAIWQPTVATYPNSTTINQLLYSSSNNIIAGLTTANGAVVNTNSAGVPALTATPILGETGVIGGQITLKGRDSGEGIIRVSINAGSNILFQLPTTDGDAADILTTNGIGGTSWTTRLGSVSIQTGAGPFTLTTEGVFVLNKAAPSATTINLPAVSTRNGLPLEIYDWAGNAGDITITPNGAETIMGLATWTVTSGGSAGTGGTIRLVPNTSLSGWLAA